MGKEEKRGAMMAADRSTRKGAGRGKWRNSRATRIHTDHWPDGKPHQAREASTLRAYGRKHCGSQAGNTYGRPFLHTCPVHPQTLPSHGSNRVLWLGTEMKMGRRVHGGNGFICLSSKRWDEGNLQEIHPTSLLPHKETGPKGTLSCICQEPLCLLQ